MTFLAKFQVVVNEMSLKFIGLFLLSSFFAASSYAFDWHGWWQTRDQQGQVLMQQKRFKEAEAAFEQKDWRGVAAYRAGDYQQALKDFASLPHVQSYYNQGNALAHLGQYQQAIQAYDKVLALDPHHQDALYNRRLLEEMLKKKQEQSQQNKNQQGKNHSDQNQQGKNQQGKNHSDQNQQGEKQHEEQGKNQQGKSQPAHNQQSEKQDEEQNENQQDQKQQAEQSENQQKQNQADHSKNEQNQQNSQAQHKQGQAQPTAQATDKTAENEKQQEKEQWLRLIPDDPGGLLREKFLRDYLHRHKELEQ